MTHDELLAKLSKDSLTFGEIASAFSALRAVVELHKPERPPFGYKGDTRLCKHCRKENRQLFPDFKGLRVLYPCPTIQAIEKELN